MSMQWRNTRAWGCCALAFGAILGLAISAVPSVRATVVVDDSWADGGRDNGPDALDSNWWTSASSSGIEVSVGSLGLVTGTSGRGIHTIFPTQTLANVGDKLTATYTFTTPATVDSGKTDLAGSFRVGLFDTLGRTGLDADVSSSSGSPNSLYGYFGTNTVGLPGYMMDMDVNVSGGEDLNFRQLDTPVTATTPTGRLMGTSTGFTSIDHGVNGSYTFAANTTYTGSISLTRLDATELQLTGTLGSANFTTTDTFDSASYGMLAFWANSNVFGSSSAANTDDNGIDFSNVKIEFTPAPEPSTLAMLGLVSLAALRRRSRVR